MSDMFIAGSKTLSGYVPRQQLTRDGTMPLTCNSLKAAARWYEADVESCGDPETQRFSTSLDELGPEMGATARRNPMYFNVLQVFA